MAPLVSVLLMGNFKSHFAILLMSCGNLEGRAAS